MYTGGGQGTAHKGGGFLGAGKARKGILGAGTTQKGGVLGTHMSSWELMYHLFLRLHMIFRLRKRGLMNGNNQKGGGPRCGPNSKKEGLRCGSGNKGGGLYRGTYLYWTYM